MKNKVPSNTASNPSRLLLQLGLCGLSSLMPLQPPSCYLRRCTSRTEHVLARRQILLASSLAFQKLGVPEVNDLDGAILLAYHDVGWLEIAVNQVSAMQVLYTAQKLRKQGQNLCLILLPRLAVEQVQQRSSTKIFENQVLPSPSRQHTSTRKEVSTNVSSAPLSFVHYGAHCLLVVPNGLHLQCCNCKIDDVL